MAGLTYLLQVNLYLLLFYVFYVVLLRNETFFKLNRIYLVGSVFLSFLIPGIQSGWVKSLFVTQQVKQATEAITVVIYDSALKISASSEVSRWQPRTIVLFIYLCGVLFFLGKLIRNLVLVYYSTRNTPGMNEAYSFFKRVVISESIQERETISTHENIHVIQWHSLDIIFFELISVINWFNPVMIMFKRAVKHIHEYIADREAAKLQPSNSDYALLLVSNAFGIAPNQLTNTFYSKSLLKKRIYMLHKTQSRRTALLKYGLSAPLFAGMLVFSSAVIPTDKPIQAIAERLENAASVSQDAMNPDSQADSSGFAGVLGALKIRMPEPVVELVSAGQTAGKVVYDFSTVDRGPGYPGGQEAFASFIRKNFKYPRAALEHGVWGKIIVRFIVERDGSVHGIKTLRDPGFGISEELIRVIREMPVWTPGYHANKPVAVMYTLPLSLAPPVDQTPVHEVPPPVVTTIPFSPPDSLVLEDAITKPTALGGDPLITLNGKAVQSMAGIKVSDIQSLELVKSPGQTLVEEYGEKAKNGLIRVILKKKNLKAPFYHLGQ